MIDATFRSNLDWANMMWDVARQDPNSTEEQRIKARNALLQAQRDYDAATQGTRIPLSDSDAMLAGIGTAVRSLSTAIPSSFRAGIQTPADRARLEREKIAKGKHGLSFPTILPSFLTPPTASLTSSPVPPPVPTQTPQNWDYLNEVTAPPTPVTDNTSYPIPAGVSAPPSMLAGQYPITDQGYYSTTGTLPYPIPQPTPIPMTTNTVTLGQNAQEAERRGLSRKDYDELLMLDQRERDLQRLSPPGRPRRTAVPNPMGGFDTVYGPPPPAPAWITNEMARISQRRGEINSRGAINQKYLMAGMTQGVEAAQKMALQDAEARQRLLQSERTNLSREEVARIGAGSRIVAVGAKAVAQQEYQKEMLAARTSEERQGILNKHEATTKDLIRANTPIAQKLFGAVNSDVSISEFIKRPENMDLLNALRDLEFIAEPAAGSTDISGTGLNPKGLSYIGYLVERFQNANQANPERVSRVLGLS